MEKWRVLFKMSTMKINYLNEKVKQKVEKFSKENQIINLVLKKIELFIVNGIINDIKIYGDSYIIIVQGYAMEVELMVSKEGNIDSISYHQKTEDVYSQNSRKIIARKSYEGSCEYEYIDENKDLDFYIQLSFTKDKDINVGPIVSELLDENHSIEDVKDIYYALGNCLNLDDLSVVIKSRDEQSYLYAFHQIIMKYRNYLRNGNHIISEYLDNNGKYYRDETIVRELSDDLIPFVKKKVM